MMYNEKMIATVKVGGKVLREFKDTVFLPYASEYEIYLKNLNTVRASVRVFIDGNDVLSGRSLIIEPNSDLSLERSIAGGNLTEGNKFKFIERTETIEKHRGIGAEDGIVRIEYQYEKIPQFQHPTFTQHSNDWYGTPRSNDWYGTPRSNVSKGIGGASLSTTRAYSTNAGITVPGGHSTQSFKQGSYFAVEDTKHVIVLRLLGESKDYEPVTNPVTVKHKPECQTCGKLNKSGSKFCSECGTSLNIFR